MEAPTTKSILHANGDTYEVEVKQLNPDQRTDKQCIRINNDLYEVIKAVKINKKTITQKEYTLTE